MFADPKGHRRLGTNPADESALSRCIHRVGQEQIFPGANPARRPTGTSPIRIRATATLTIDDQGVPLSYGNMAVSPFFIALYDNAQQRRRRRFEAAWLRVGPSSCLLAREHARRAEDQRTSKQVAS